MRAIEEQLEGHLEEQRHKLRSPAGVSRGDIGRMKFKYWIPTRAALEG